MSRPSRSALALIPFALAALAVGAAPHSAQAARPAAWADSAGALSPAADAHRPGRWSLDFGIGSNFTLNSFKGASISLTRNTSLHSAWQAGLSYGLLTDDRTRSFAQISDTVVTSGPGQSSSHQQVSLSAVLLRLHRVHPARRVAAYFAVGPSVSWQRLHDENESLPIGTISGSVANHYAHTLFVGLAGDLGVEAFVTRDVSLHASYGSVGGYQFSKDVQRRQGIDPATGRPGGSVDEAVAHDHGWQVTANSVRFGVSLYL